MYIKAGAANMAGTWFITSYTGWCGRCVVYTDRWRPASVYSMWCGLTTNWVIDAFNSPWINYCYPQCVFHWYFDGLGITLVCITLVCQFLVVSLLFSLVWQFDKPTDHATQSVTIDRMYVRSTGDVV